MAANIVEYSHLPGAIAHRDQRQAGSLERDLVTGVGQFVVEQQGNPAAGEHFFPFSAKHGRVGVGGAPQW
jgi:hypothetical protein